MRDLFTVIIAIFAISIFCMSSYLIYDLFKNGFDIYVLLGAILGYVIVHFIWPKNRNSGNAWYDALEFVVDLPYKALALALRAVFSRSEKSDLDIDL